MPASYRTEFMEWLNNKMKGEGLKVRKLKDEGGVRFEALTVNDVATTDKIQFYIAYMSPRGLLSDVFLKEATGTSVDFRDEGARPALRMTDANVYQLENTAYNLRRSVWLLPDICCGAVSQRPDSSRFGSVLSSLSHPPQAPPR